MRSTPQPLSAVTARWLVDRAEQYATQRMPVLSNAESPLEAVMTASLLLALGPDRLAAQRHIAPYRVDLLVDEWLVVEVDGYQYHYRHRQDVLSDRRRDRWLAKCGYHVIRFVGAEVWADVQGCTDEVVAIAETKTTPHTSEHCS